MNDFQKDKLSTVNLKNVEIIDKFMTVEEVAKFLSLKTSTVYAKVCKRQLPHYKKGKFLYFKKSEQLEWLETGKTLHK